MSRVVIIEESRESIEALASHLRRLGIEVAGFWDPEIALRRCLGDPPDLLVTELRAITPTGLDGLEVMETLRRQLSGIPLSILALSVRADEESLMAAYEAGADDVLVKPVRVPEFRARVRRLLQQVEGRRQPREIVVDRIPEGPIDPGRPLIYGNYRVRRMLGRGGMGVVYLGERLDTGEAVAIKRVSGLVEEDPVTAYRFVREAQVLKVVDHPHIVRFVDLSLGAADACLVMEYVEGPSLQRLVTQSGGISPRRALHLIGQVAQAVDYLSQKGIVHGDLKPANLLVAAGDHVKLTDFGVARRPLDPEITSPGLVVGTLPMLSPERIRGRPPDGAGEVYAMGVLLYYSLTGAYPFYETEPAAMLMAVLNGNPDRNRLHAAGVPESVIQLALRCMDADPRRRPYPPGSVVRQMEELRASLPEE